MGEIVRLERFDNTPWGFRLTGGYDFGTPLSVIKVTGGSIAALCGVKVGDIVTEINGQSTKNFIHKDAQNFIGISGNHLTLTVLRGSLITPDVTPSRGRTPAHDQERDNTPFDEKLLNDRLEKTAKELNDDETWDEQDEPIVHENVSMTAEMQSGKVHSGNQGEILDPNVTDTELDELLTGNEEVLDEGVLGINFKKFLPQVDFIRQSEVFKFLQNENTMKEIPEEEQLQKEPAKRFSTFLQKPKPPPPKPRGPLWYYPKAPRYLPREVAKEPEQPRRRPKRDSCHTVLWLFLGETGEQVIDERWGSEEEERINLSRCEMREDDSISLSSSITTGAGGRDSRLDKLEEIAARAATSEALVQKVDENSESHVEEDYARNVEQYTGVLETDSEYNKDFKTMSAEEQCCKVVASTEDETCNENLKVEQNETTETSIEKEVFSRQLADIQAQIAALEIQAPSDLQNQLLAIQDQLSKIVTVKNVHVTNSKESRTDETIQHREFNRSEYTKVEEEEKLLEELSEDCYEYTFECEAKINNNNKSKYSSDNEKQGDCDSESLIDESDRHSEGSESAKDETDSSNMIEEFQKGEYEICEVPAAAKVKKRGHPITPQKRPIVLPGGRMWREPKDACHDDFYQGVLVAQAEVMIGNTGGVNFTKYVPPKFDMSHSAVYKLVHEIEDKTRALNEEQEHYHTPIGKRHFYAATLREPDPIGGIDL